MIATIVLKCLGVRFVWWKVAFWWRSIEVFRYVRLVCLYVCIERGNVLRGNMCCKICYELCRYTSFLEMLGCLYDCECVESEHVL